SWLIDAPTSGVLVHQYSRSTSLNILEENPVIPEPNHVEDAHDPNEMVDIPNDEDLVDYDGDDEEPEEEPKQQTGHGNQFAQHPNPQPGNMNGWLEEDDDVNENVINEDIKDKAVEVEVDDEAKLIFPYDMEGDQTPPPRDESSDFATAGTVAQSPFAIRDFSRGIVEVGESSAARDSSYVGGLAPWALRRDLETSCARARLIEAELNVERTLSIVLESLKVLESGENATLKKKLAEKEMQLVIARMDHASAERRLHESIGWNRMFYMEMVCKGAVSKPSSEDESTERPRKKSKKPSSDGTEGPYEPRGPPTMSEAQMYKIIRDQVAASMAEFMANMNCGTGDAETDVAGTGGAKAGGAEAGGARQAVPEITGCTYVTFMKCNPQPFKGTEGAVGLCQWFEKLESMFRISDCKEKDKVKFATATLQGRALTWWNGRITSMGIDATNGTPWIELKGTDIDGYTNRFHKLALLCPRMEEPEQVKMEQYIRGLSENIHGDVTSSRPAGIEEAVGMAYKLMGQIIQDKTDKVSEGEKQKGE
nr:hypothetical protein [Tanacetum cinerariifolium]